MRVLHREVGLTALPRSFQHGVERRKRRKIEGSAEALRVRHHPTIFPSEWNNTHNAARATARTKRCCMAVFMSLQTQRTIGWLLFPGERGWLTGRQQGEIFKNRRHPSCVE